ncbi:MAG: hypothetical protein EXR75_06775 [Myxococcales bacterium]|nr:hypothetical protein [Myxococcales bacterium]
MSEQSFPVTVAVRRPDGSIEQVRVGTAVRAAEGFRLTLGDLSIGAVDDVPGRRAPAPSADGGPVFPPYGRSKGTPIAGASMGDLEFYASGCRRTLADPAKERWHEKERALMAMIEAEMARQGGRSQGDEQGARDASAARTGEDFGSMQRHSVGMEFDDGGPPLSDDDIPF